MSTPTTLLRRVNESPRAYYFSFAGFPELAQQGDSLASVSSITATPSGLTIGTGAVVGQKVKVTISGGVNGVTYLVKCLAVTAGGSYLEVDGYLGVQDAS